MVLTLQNHSHIWEGAPSQNCILIIHTLIKDTKIQNKKFNMFLPLRTTLTEQMPYIYSNYTQLYIQIPTRIYSTLFLFHMA